MRNLIKRALPGLLAFLLTLALFESKAVQTIPLLFSDDISPFIVSGNSMIPTLEEGQNVTVHKHREAYSRGDIIIMIMPEAGYPFSAIKEPVHIVKRVVGLPGECVDIGADNTIRINGKILDEPYLTEDAKEASYVPGRENHFELSENMYFVVGDNRAVSCDSRYFGGVEFDAIIGVIDPDLPDMDSLLRDTFLIIIGMWVSFKILNKLLTLIFHRKS